MTRDEALAIARKRYGADVMICGESPTHFVVAVPRGAAEMDRRTPFIHKATSEVSEARRQDDPAYFAGVVYFD
jgi:hypothetical protein